MKLIKLHIFLNERNPLLGLLKFGISKKAWLPLVYLGLSAFGNVFPRSVLQTKKPKTKKLKTEMEFWNSTW